MCDAGTVSSSLANHVYVCVYICVGFLFTCREDEKFVFLALKVLSLDANEGTSGVRLELN